ncbi:hypothetical protein [Proteus mirabilis]|uniref:hypothetical protein n=1 Tax=Proteus mirabilis TaxID=584 RepID=UPI0034E51756
MKTIRDSPVDYELREHLITAWRDSEQAYVNVINNFYIQFWEKQSELAYQLDEVDGRLIGFIRDWMDECQKNRLDTAYLYDDLFLRYLNKNNLLPDMTI